MQHNSPVLPRDLVPGTREIYICFNAISLLPVSISIVVRSCPFPEQFPPSPWIWSRSRLSAAHTLAAWQDVDASLLPSSGLLSVPTNPNPGQWTWVNIHANAHNSSLQSPHGQLSNVSISEYFRRVVSTSTILHLGYDLLL